MGKTRIWGEDRAWDGVGTKIGERWQQKETVTSGKGIPVREGYKTRGEIIANDKFGGEGLRMSQSLLVLPLKGGRTSCGGPEDRKLEHNVGGRGWYSSKKMGSHRSHR